MTEERWLVIPDTEMVQHPANRERASHTSTLVIHIPADFIEAWRNGATSAVPPAPLVSAAQPAAGGSGAVAAESTRHRGPTGKRTSPAARARQRASAPPLHSDD